MNKKFLALALTGALTLTMLTACAKPGGEVTPSPTPSIAPTETVPPTPTPTDDIPAIEPTDAPVEGPATTPDPTQPATLPTQKPSETPKPSEKPSEKPKPSETPKPSESAKPEKSVVQSVWDEVSSQERPSLMDLDESLLTDFYGIASGDLVEYIAKMPMMSANITEFLIAKCAPGKVDSVKEACLKRQGDLASNTLYPESVKLVESYKLVTSGDYIIFCIDEYAADMVTAFNTYAK